MAVKPMVVGEAKRRGSPYGLPLFFSLSSAEMLSWLLARFETILE